jgi:hypothetical protein
MPLRFRCRRSQGVSRTAKILARGWDHECLRGKTGKSHHGDQAWLLSLHGIKPRQARLEAETRAPEGISLSVLDCVSGKPWCGVLRVDLLQKGPDKNKLSGGGPVVLVEFSKITS